MQKPACIETALSKLTGEATLWNSEYIDNLPEALRTRVAQQLIKE